MPSNINDDVSRSDLIRLRMIRVAVIPARLGSQELPKKNRARIGGASLVERAIDVARQSRVCELIVLTSDDPVLIRQALRRGVMTIERPQNLAGPRVETAEVVRHALASVERVIHETVDSVVLLEPTTPLRTPSDIRNAVALNEGRGRPNVASMVAVREAGWLCALGRGDRIVPLSRDLHARRQDVQATYAPNGAVYVLTRRSIDRPWYEGAVGYVMPFDRSVDIDTAADLRLARLIYSARPERRK